MYIPKNHGTFFDLSFFPVQNTLSQKMFRDFMDVLNDAKMTTKKETEHFPNGTQFECLIPNV